MLISGEGGLPSDPKTAKAILTRVSELGMVEAQLRLADYYEKGLDGRPDLIRAYALALAAGENENAKKVRASLEKKMGKEQIDLAKKEFDRMKAAPAPKEGEKAAPPADGKKNQ